MKAYLSRDEMRSISGGSGSSGSPACKCVHDTGYEWTPNVTNCDQCFIECQAIFGHYLKSTWCFG